MIRETAARLKDEHWRTRRTLFRECKYAVARAARASSVKGPNLILTDFHEAINERARSLAGAPLLKRGCEV